jgi:molecular chaperone GrpE
MGIRRRPLLEEETIENDHTDQLKNILQLLEEIAEDNMAVVESLNRVREAQDTLRSDVTREIEQLRDEWTSALTFRALNDICGELIPPLTAMETMLQQAEFADAQTVVGHVDSLAFTLRNILRRMGAEKISVSPGEEVFDPAIHLCVRLLAPEESPFPGALPRTVVRVVEDGYTLGGRVLSPAKVEVQSGNRS